ncbi:MAG: hypothetical protein WC076_02770 [Terrimicrobiaceae bacterium]
MRLLNNDRIPGIRRQGLAGDGPALADDFAQSGDAVGGRVTFPRSASFAKRDLLPYLAKGEKCFVR